MTEQEDKRFMKRKAVFVTEGLPEEDALDLAYSMMMRDRDPQDDRRVCFECSNYTGKYCMKMRDRLGKPQIPLRFILQRCDDFELKGTK
jgi:hypothetical protein